MYDSSFLHSISASEIVQSISFTLLYSSYISSFSFLFSYPLPSEPSLLSFDPPDVSVSLAWFDDKVLVHSELAEFGPLLGVDEFDSG